MTSSLPPIPQLYLYRNKVFILSLNSGPVKPGIATVEPAYIGTLLNNMLALGFVFNPLSIDQLKGLSASQLGNFYHSLIPLLKEKVGADKPFDPMYHNFPQQVMEASQADLFINAILHYWFGLLPDYEKTPRPMMSLPTLSETRVLELANENELKQIVQNLLGSKSALSKEEQSHINWFFQTYGNEAITTLPDQILFKETLALVANCLLKYTSFEADTLKPYVKTATDVLRIAVAMSEGDISLSTATKFKSFNRPQRRLLLGLLEAQTNIIEDVLRYPERWKRLTERLHPGEMKNRFPRASECITLVRQGSAYPTFNHNVEQNLQEKDFLGALELLQLRPGELARRLDHLLRSSTDPTIQKAIWETFERVAPQISTPVLLQVLTHFKVRNTPHSLRTFFPKGEVAKAQAIPNQLPQLEENLSIKQVKICRQALIARFSQLPPLGKVFVDESLRKYMVPLAERTSNKSLRTLARGTRLPLPAGSTIRFFLWWKEGEGADGKPTGRVDLDLSAVMYDADWQYKEHISYTNLKSETYKAAHSGDIVTAPNGACEFIDLDIASVVEYGGRYIIMSVNSYTRHPFNRLPECFAGWMIREAPQSGEIFEPSTVVDKVDLTADTTIGLPVILDLVEHEVLWVDLALKSKLRRFNSIEGNQSNTLLMGQALTGMVKPDLYELFNLHAQARGTLVAGKEEANIIFAPDGTVTPFDHDIIKAQYL